jgi:hypothetical protein
MRIQESLVLFLIAGYIGLRYVVFGPLHWGSDALLLTNKFLSFSFVGLLFLQGLARWLPLEPATQTRDWQRLFLWGHVLASGVLLAGGAYPELVPQGVLEGRGQWLVLTGMVSLAFLFWPGVRCRPKRLGWSLAWLLAHLAVRGGPGWGTPEHWHGGLPPISLLAALMVLWTLASSKGRGKGSEV